MKRWVLQLSLIRDLKKNEELMERIWKEVWRPVLIFRLRAR